MITSNSNPHVKQVVLWQTKAKERKTDGIFIVEGRKMLLEAPREWIREVYVSESYLKQEKPLPAEISYEEVSDSVFEKMSDTKTPQGVLAVIQRPDYSLDDIISNKKGTPLLVMLENLQDPGNLGTIIRTSEGAGVTGVILSKDCVDLFNPKVVRSTMGSIYRVPFLYVEDFREALKEVKRSGIHTYAAHLSGKKYYDEFDFSEATAFLIGNEGNGLTKETADLAESYLRIPMEGKLESLNAAVATSLLIYESHRQRRK